MTPGPTLTILHLSDMQFGKNHRFGDGAGSVESHFETLRQRLEDDLMFLKREYSLSPNLVVATGDLAEWGLKTELKAAFGFLAGIQSFLGLGRDRVAIVPGNHDINRKLCQAYILECEGNGDQPQRPYWPKWRPFAESFGDFYKDVPGVSFTPDQPYSLFEIPDLNVAVAGINSTIAESHLDADHHGEIGEEQARWFSDRLEEYRHRSWLRIGILHHNFDPVAVRDDERLHDVTLLKTKLGPFLNLLLHGHTHGTSYGALLPNVPVYSCGSAAVKDEALPPHTPNQYQILQIWAGRVRRFTRCYFPERGTWGPDPRGSSDTQDSEPEERIGFIGADATLGCAASPLDERRGFSERPRFATPDHGFLAIVAETCEALHKDAKIVYVDADGLQYLRVSCESSGISEFFPVAAFELAPTLDQIEGFARIAAQFRTHDSTKPASVVYGGISLVADDVKLLAGKRGLTVRSLADYQGLIDFREYLERQKHELAAIPGYAERLYVPQDMEFEERGECSATQNAFEKACEWLAEPHGRFILILGDFGTGKTFLLRKLATHLAKPETCLTPLLIELRSLEKSRSLDELMVQHLVRRGLEDINLGAFRHMLRQGRLCLLFDGFDELAMRVTYDRAIEHFATVLDAAGGGAKVVVTSRTTYFERDDQVRKELGRRVTDLGAPLRYCRLLHFGEDKIQRFLVNRFGTQSEADAWFALLKDVNNLLGLSQYPRMLSFITDLDRAELERARDRVEKISAATLYHKLIVEKWLEHEYNRLSPKGSESVLGQKERLTALTHIAMILWGRADRWITVPEMTAEMAELARILVTERAPEAAAVVHQIGSGSLLVRDEDGRFTFAHQSILEWLVANQAAEELLAARDSQTLSRGEFSPLMAEFLSGLQREAAVEWAERIGETEDEYSQIAKSNALRILETAQGGKRLRLAGQDLRNQDFTALDLRSADLREANLEKVVLRGKDLSSARLDGASLRGADLRRAVLNGASIQNADFSFADVSGADLRGTSLEGSSWVRTKLTKVLHGGIDWKELKTFGAAIGPEYSAVPTIPFASGVTCVTWNADGTLLATGHQDGTIWLWSVAGGKQIRPLKGHEWPVTSLSFSPDSVRLASASVDLTVRLWDVEFGRLTGELRGHLNFVTSVTFSPDGLRIASGSFDTSVRLWDASTGRHIQTFWDPVHSLGWEGRRPLAPRAASDQWDDSLVLVRDTPDPSRSYLGGVTSVAFNRDGSLIACGTWHRIVYIRDVVTGKPSGRLEGHANSISSLAFSPDGSRIVTGSHDRTVRIWDTATAAEIRVQRTASPVTAVAISHDGTIVAAGSRDQRITAWREVDGSTIASQVSVLGQVRAVAFSPERVSLASACDGGLALWSPVLHSSSRWLTAGSATTGPVAISQGGDCIEPGTSDRSIRVWDIETGKVLRTVRGLWDAASVIAVSRDGRRVACGRPGEAARLWDAETGRQVCVIGDLGRFRHAAAINADGTVVAFAAADGSVHVWDVATGRRQLDYERKGGRITALSFCADGTRITAGTTEGDLFWGDAATGETLSLPGRHVGPVSAVAFSPDETRIVSGCRLGTVRVWEVATRRFIRSFSYRGRPISAVAFSPGGRLIALGLADGRVRIWDLERVRDDGNQNRHVAAVRSLVFAHDGRRLVSSSDDNTIGVWDVASGRLIARLLGTRNGWVAFKPDGRYKFSGDISGSFWHSSALCRFEPGELDEFVPGLRMEIEEPLV